ncbi:MAG: RsmE family RNA methyltransferase [Verrucomicrobiota bacterium]
MHRFYLPNFQQPVLSAEETHHATHVLRLKPGDIVNAFDGRGHEAQCRVAAAGKLTILQQSTTPVLPCRITLAQAVPKKNMDLIVEKATELGVATIIPLLSERTIVQLDENARKLDRWREIALESCKQCGNNWLPVIESPRKVPAFLADTGKFDLKLIASLQPGSQPLKAILGTSRPRSVLVMIGPEGDFTPAEISAAKNAGCLPLSLGPLVLRAETAAIYTLSILHNELQSA